MDKLVIPITGFRLDDLYVPRSLLHFNPPALAPKEPWSLEKECQSALARLHVSIEANVAYNLKQMEQSYRVVMRKYNNSPLQDFIDRSRIRIQNDAARDLINWHHTFMTAGGGGSGGMPLSLNRIF